MLPWSYKVLCSCLYFTFAAVPGQELWVNCAMNREMGVPYRTVTCSGIFLLLVARWRWSLSAFRFPRMPGRCAGGGPEAVAVSHRLQGRAAAGRTFCRPSQDLGRTHVSCCHCSSYKSLPKMRTWREITGGNKTSSSNDPVHSLEGRVGSLTCFPHEGEMLTLDWKMSRLFSSAVVQWK